MHEYHRYGGAPMRFDMTLPVPLPLHPTGRKGLAGPGAAGDYGPKLAIDAVVVRNNPKHGLEVLIIKRQDTGDWALPGGKRDPLANGELESEAVAMQRRTAEEAGVELPVAAFAKAPILFARGLPNDPRDTDNFWFETQARLVVVPWKTAQHLTPEQRAE